LNRLIDFRLQEITRIVGCFCNTNKFSQKNKSSAELLKLLNFIHSKDVLLNPHCRFPLFGLLHPAAVTVAPSSRGQAFPGSSLRDGTALHQKKKRNA
jgi:hypothetical protein